MTPQDRAELFIKRLVRPLIKSQPLEGDEVPRIEPDPKNKKPTSRLVRLSAGNYKMQKIKKRGVRPREVTKRSDTETSKPYQKTRKPFMYDDPDPNEY